MKFNDFDAKMRLYETAGDQFVPPDMYIVARLDGRGFTQLTKETLDLEKPFSVEFREVMQQSVVHLMKSGFNIQYGYTQSDEISLLFHRDEHSFGRKYRKLLSILAGEASASFTYHMHHIGVFDCRLCILPNLTLVTDYFVWRAEDAHRNSLNAYCYWKLRETGKSVADATNQLEKLTVAEKNELLFSMNINYNDLPAWQKRGIGFYWEKVHKKGFNPLTKTETTVERRELIQELELPLQNYKEWLMRLIA
jgi:tRNA(His) 5'-end guanylyltransferase